MTSIKKFGSFINETDSYKENGRFTYKGNDVVLAGKSKYPVGTKIKIKKINGEDKELSGLTGTLTHPFAFGSGDVGVYLDKKGVYTDDKVNLKNSEYDVVDDEALKLIKNNESLKTYESSNSDKKLSKKEKENKIKSLVVDMLKESHKIMLKNMDELFQNGHIDIENWNESNNQMILPKCIVIALLQNESNQYDGKGTSFEKEVKKEVSRIRYHL